MNHSFSSRLGANSTETLITTFHPTLSPFVAKTLSQLEPEYGPGSIEYEVAVNFLKYSAEPSVSKPLRAVDCNFVSTKRPGLPREHFALTKELAWREYKERAMDECRYSEAFLSNFERTTPFQSQVPPGSLLFLFGFLLMPCWWIGAVFPRKPRNKIQQQWRLYNRLMSIVSGMILVLGVSAFIWYMK